MWESIGRVQCERAFLILLCSAIDVLVGSVLIIGNFDQRISAT